MSYQSDGSSEANKPQLKIKSHKKDALWQTFIGALCEAVGGILSH